MQVSIRRFLSELKGVEEISGLGDEILPFVELALKTFLRKPEEFDRGCQFNILNIGESFTRALSSSGLDANSVGDLFVDCYRFFSEFNFYRDSNFPGSIAYDVGQALNKIRYKTSGIPKGLKDQIVYADNFMPVSLAKEFLSKPDFEVVRKFDVKYGELKEVILELDTKLASEKEEVKILHDALNKYKNAFNFVGLYKGFDDIAKSKRLSANFSVILMCVLALLMLAPFVWKIWCGVVGAGDQFSLDLFLAFVGFDLLLLYFFRVVFHGYKSLKGQLVQLDLRRAACQFIQSYANYAKDIRVGNPALLERFETLVFSGIVTNEDNIPSSFDGLDQISKIIEKFKGS